MNLVVRAATDDDVEQVTELNRDGNGEQTAMEIQAGFSAGAFSANDFVVACDGPKVVCTLCLLSLPLSLGNVSIPTGQPEFVVTHPDYRGRGLVRTLLDHVHQLSDERGNLIQLIAGIPYFYRQFGYDYAIPFSPERLIPPETNLGSAGNWKTRPATTDDFPVLRTLQTTAQAPADLRIAFADEVWTVLANLPHVELAVAEDPDGHVAGVARIRRTSSGQMRVTNLAADNVGAARALLVRARLARPSTSLVVADRIASPVSVVLATGSLPSRRRDWLYVRTPDPAALLAHLRPVLSARLSKSSLGHESGEAHLSLYRSMEDHPDVNLGADRELLRALFPPIRADVLMW